MRLIKLLFTILIAIGLAACSSEEGEKVVKEKKEKRDLAEMIMYEQIEPIRRNNLWDKNLKKITVERGENGVIVTAHTDLPKKDPKYNHPFEILVELLAFLNDESRPNEQRADKALVVNEKGEVLVEADTIIKPE